MSNIHIIVSKKESVRVLRSCISSLESGLGAIYKVQKDKGQLRSLRIFIIRPGAFDQLSELAIKNGTSATSQHSHKKVWFQKVKEQLRLVFVEFYQKLLHLKDYSFMNLSAFSMIMKKYEKHTSRAASAAYMTVVDNSYVILSQNFIDSLMHFLKLTFYWRKWSLPSSETLHTQITKRGGSY
ncbi:hypothetical protein GYH30_024564 [Glycine max]|uniref:SPX domain-containing protein n=2 Tax=Glycine subgen. Soja TaxID=1462606 RepID=K7LCU9_SOYBN|nr:hypothetical protein GYH30_024564 [Glycine max]RZB91385.1 Phosphate transporter PHO1-like 10 [Glycine soja]